MRILTILAALVLLLIIGLVAFDADYWTHVSLRGPDRPSANVQTA